MMMETGLFGKDQVACDYSTLRGMDAYLIQSLPFQVCSDGSYLRGVTGAGVAGLLSAMIEISGT